MDPSTTNSKTISPATSIRDIAAVNDMPSSLISPEMPNML